MSRIIGIQCDVDDCKQITHPAHCAAEGWLCVGGNRRGRYRTDLCPYHARVIVNQLSESMQKKRKKRR